MHLLIPSIAVPPGPAVAGAILATGTYLKIHQTAYRLLKKWIITNSSNNTVSIRSRCKKEILLSHLSDQELKKASRRSRYETCKNIKTIFPGTQIENAPFKNLQNDSEDSETEEDLKEIVPLCNVNNNVKFSYAIPFWKQAFATKIAEGSYGEIYTLKHVDGSCRVFKCMPLGGRHPIKMTPNIPLAMAIPDIVCSTSLSKLNEGPYYIAPNYPKVYSINIVKDAFPQTLMRPWWDYKNSPRRLKDPSEHPQPDMFPEDQIFLTIESSFCGYPLMCKVLQNAWLGASIMSQLVSALAVAESAYNFEHRDLHLGNILIKNTDSVSLKYTIHDLHFAVQTIGHQVFIIDFTLSRIYSAHKVYCVQLDQCVYESRSQNVDSDNVWLDHKSMYKIMSHYSQGQWTKYMPITNIIWLKYINENILAYLQKNNPGLRKLAAETSEKDQMRAMRLLRKWNNSILEHTSAANFLKNVILKDNPLVAVEP